ncbi:hypothetical protein JCM1840_000521 [Sporobolomyces johnsonii]
MWTLLRGHLTYRSPVMNCSRLGAMAMSTTSKAAAPTPKPEQVVPAESAKLKQQHPELDGKSVQSQVRDLWKKSDEKSALEREKAARESK